MILKRLKLFTAGLPGTPGYTFSDYNSVMNNNNAANANAANGASTGTAATNAGTNAGGSGAGNAAASANTPADPKPGANATTNAASAAANTGAAKPVSVTVPGGTKAAVPLKDANPKVTFDPKNVKFDVNGRIEELTHQNSQLQSQLDAANKAKVESAARGRVAGRNQVGVWQGLKNTWNKAGTMKKIGMGGAALAGTYFLGKGLLGGNNNNNQ